MSPEGRFHDENTLDAAAFIGSQARAFSPHADSLSAIPHPESYEIPISDIDLLVVEPGQTQRIRQAVGPANIFASHRNGWNIAFLEDNGHRYAINLAPPWSI